MIQFKCQQSLINSNFPFLPFCRSSNRSVNQRTNRSVASISDVHSVCLYANCCYEQQFFYFFFLWLHQRNDYVWVHWMINEIAFPLNCRTGSVVIRSCHAHTRFTGSVLLRWFRMACKYTQKVHTSIVISVATGIRWLLIALFDAQPLC